MARTIVYFVHPGQRFSKANAALTQKAKTLEGITFVDLYAEYPRHDIDIEAEQARLLAHDKIMLQFPMYWYSTPTRANRTALPNEFSHTLYSVSALKNDASEPAKHADGYA